MKTEFLDTVKKYSMFSPGEKVVVGLSGGADSMCLVSLLNDLRDELNISVCAVHINHLIRGDEAERDELFVRNFCRYKDIPLTVFRRDIPRISAETGESTELAARRVRYECFNECDADKIATAHTASDRIETFLFNLSRGSSLNGLCSIPPVRDNIVRPLIAVTRNEIEVYCKENNIEYITDSTNLTDEYTRNKYRLNVIPELNAINPSFEKNALRCIEFLNDENAYIEGAAKKILEKNLLSEERLSLTELINENPAVIRRVIVEFLKSQSVSEYEHSHIGIITDNIGNKFAVCLPGHHRIESDGEFLFVKNKSDISMCEPLTEYVFNINDGISFFKENINFKAYISWEKPSEHDAFYADAEKAGGQLVFRSKLAGDVIRPGKSRCTKPLRKLFNELKIPVEERDHKYVLADEKGVIFVEDIGFDASRLCDKNTKKYLIVKTEEIVNEK